MTNRVQDACLGAILLLFAGGWTWLVVDTIPLGLGDGDIGARAFPLAYGIILLVLVVLSLLRLLAAKKKSLTPIKVTDAEMSGVGKIHWLPMLMVLIEIILYGFLLEKIGFVLATPIVVLLGMIFPLPCPFEMINVRLCSAARPWCVGITCLNGIRSLTAFSKR